eukprot:TRINITY_DN90_c1_g1_i1.p1 TRINITY_DN90_c1_g1~~TRINITY_DN90_c1_g1_i1.p1  ORF type:complete len:757 (+),score=88.99 TRINITY_DN90_c1_g1_i1:69-2339(+)
MIIKSLVCSVGRFLYRILYEPCFTPKDTSLELVRKKLAVTATLAILIVLATTWKSTEKSSLERIAYTYGMTISAAFYLWIRISKSCTDALIASMTALSAVSIFMFDLLRASSRQSRTWPLFIILMDFQLTSRTWKATTIFTVFAVILWLIVSGTESVLRFGLFDIPGLTSQDSRREACSCPSLPCAEETETQLSFLGVHLLVFLLDFLCTFSFCEGMYCEKERIEASVRAANEVANHLALFDLPKAEESLTSARETIPASMAQALEVLLGNLKEYRPFLPEALFSTLHCHFDEYTSTSSSLPPPGKQFPDSEGVSDEVEVAILFTDIVGSTMSWESYPGAMRVALKIHNEIMRQQATCCHGYEVKTIGDAFMLAFNSPIEACEFAVGVQEIFSKTEWPSQIQELNNKEGILIRIGISYGKCLREMNPTTKRSDYVGQMVNKAARIEGRCLPGCIALDDEVMSVVKPHLHRIGAESQSLGTPQTVKGIQEAIQLHSLVPSSLRYRLESPSTEPSGHPATWTLESVESSTASTTSSMLTTIERKTRQKRVPATICSLFIASSSADPVTTLLDRVERVSLTLDRSGGSVLSVTGAVLTLGFNISRPCKSHTENSFRFAELLRGFFSDSEGYCCAHLGISSGSCVQTVVVNSSEQRFVTGIGIPFSLSFLLCVSASEKRIFALFANPQGSLPKSGCLRLCSIWYDTECGRVAVYELRQFYLSNLIGGDCEPDEVQQDETQLFTAPPSPTTESVRHVVLFG